MIRKHCWDLTPEGYKETYEFFKAGDINKTDWQAYCTRYLMYLMAQNEEYFIRLKYK